MLWRRVACRSLTMTGPAAFNGIRTHNRLFQRNYRSVHRGAYRWIWRQFNPIRSPAAHVAEQLPLSIRCVRTQEMLSFWLQDGGELRHSSRQGWTPTPTLRIAVCRGRDAHRTRQGGLMMAACCPAQCGMSPRRDVAAGIPPWRATAAPDRLAHTGPFGRAARSRRRCIPSWRRHRLVPRRDITDGGDR